MDQQKLRLNISLAICVVILILLVGYGSYSYLGMHKSNLFLSDSLVKERIRNQELSLALSTTTAALNTIEEQVGSLSSTVVTLEKLKETDPELLTKYSKVFFLSENYIPKGLVDIDAKYHYDPTKKLLFLTKAYTFFEDMIEAASSTGLTLKVASAYRSFETQSGLKSAYKVTYGAGTANSFSADQGYSEHQLGSTVDFTTPSLLGNLEGFDKTPEYEWLLDNAYKFGFILSYPKNNSYYIYEPWHWRFVGLALAKRLREEHENFYDLDQRQIDPYLVKLFDKQ
jgi:D-alanyl-D-alanine carboxypeptidase